MMIIINGNKIMRYACEYVIPKASINSKMESLRDFFRFSKKFLTVKN